MTLNSANFWPGIRFGVMGAIVTAVIALSAACVPQVPAQSALPTASRDTACVAHLAFLGQHTNAERRLQARQCVNRVDGERRAQALHYAAPAITYLSSLPWEIPEYHDEQRLPDGNGGFGPMAYIYASPALGGFTSLGQFAAHGDRGVLVGIVSLVQTMPGEAIPATYTDLGLGWGLNCIYLSYRATGPQETRWHGYVTNSGTAPNTPCSRTNNPKPLEAHATRQAPYGLKDNIPVARFSDTMAGTPLLGVACVDAWCEIGPNAKDARPTEELGGPKLRIKGWHDEQLLAESDGSGGLKPSTRATIVPHDAIDELQLSDFAEWVEIADIRLKQDPPTTSKYYKWGLRKGKNVLELRMVGTTFEAQVTSWAGGVRVTRPWEFIEPRHPHEDAAVPGTARFRWTIADEGIWVPCGQGCCKVEGIAAQ